MKHIQTEISEKDYTRFKHILKKEGKTIKQGVREAIEIFMKMHEESVEKDPVFNIIGSFKTKEGDWSRREDWRTPR